MIKKLTKTSIFLLPGVFYVQAYAYIYKCKKMEVLKPTK